MVLDKFIREAAGHFIWLLNIVFVWFKQCQHQHAAAWSNSVLLVRASVTGYWKKDSVCSVCSCLGSSCPSRLVPRGAGAGVNPGVYTWYMQWDFLPAQDVAKQQQRAAVKREKNFLFPPFLRYCPVFLLTLKKQHQKKTGKLLRVLGKSSQVSYCVMMWHTCLCLPNHLIKVAYVTSFRAFLFRTVHLKVSIMYCWYKV